MAAVAFAVVVGSIVSIGSCDLFMGTDKHQNPGTTSASKGESNTGLDSADSYAAGTDGRAPRGSNDPGRFEKVLTPMLLFGT